MKLEEAFICIDCNEVTDKSPCPACASYALINLSLWVPFVITRAKLSEVLKRVTADSSEVITVPEQVLSHESSTKN